MTALPETCSHCLVRDLTLCADLPKVDLHALDRIAVHRHVADGTVLIASGEESPYCAHILTGMVKLQIVSQDGRSQTVGLLGPGDFLGQPLEGHSRLTATALGQVSLCLYSRVAFEQLMEGRPAFVRALLRQTAESLEAARERQVALAQKTAMERLADFLIKLPRVGTDDHVTVPLSRTDLAEYLGVTIETISRQLGKLKEDGILSFARADRDLVIRDRNALQLLAGA